MKKYPSIEQFRNIVRKVREQHDYQGRDAEDNPIYSHTSNYPTLEFQGTVKLHGTNAGVVKYSDGRIEFQSRERVLSLQSDNSGFMNHYYDKHLLWLFDKFTYKDYVAIYGEWCGGNIQKGVAISGLPKMFVIFGIMIDDKWIELSKDIQDNVIQIYNILQFPTYSITIDFNKPELSQNELIEKTIEVENCCPVGKLFNVEGIGEGIVFTCTTNQEFKFKSKGEKHSASKVKTLNSIDVETLESINVFVESVVSENRLNQGLAYFKENNIEIDAKNTGKFLSWIVSDVLKEEKDTLDANGLDEKKVKGAIVTKARMWFLNTV